MATYVKEYFEYYRSVEDKYKIPANYMAGQVILQSLSRFLLKDSLKLVLSIV